MIKRTRPLARHVSWGLSVFCAAYCTTSADAVPLHRGDERVNMVGVATVYPVMGSALSSDYGMRKHPISKRTRHHDGVDLAAPLKAPIRAIARGRIIYADPFGGYGRFVVVLHDDGYTSHYGHCEDIYVSPGEQVAPGQLIATVGSSGSSTGPHLHFEIRRNGKAEDPEAFLPGLSIK